jgi:hypothetical protein
MPSYVITGPDGKKYRVSGQGSPEEALAAVKQQAGASAAPVVPQKSGGLAPISSTPDGGWQWDMNAGIAGMIKRAVTLPGDVYSGKVQMNDPETGRTSDEVIKRSTDLAAIASPMNPATRATGNVLPGAGDITGSGLEKVVAAPSRDALKATGSRQFDEGREIGETFRYRPEVVSAFGSKLNEVLRQKGFNESSAPKTVKGIASEFGDGTKPLSYDDLLAAKNYFQNIRTDFTNPPDREAAEKVLGLLYRLIESGDERLVMGNPASSATYSNTGAPITAAAAAAKRVAELNQSARGNYAAAKRSDRITGKLDKADRQASAANSGVNIDNSIRQRANDILNSEKLMQGYTPEEIAAIRAIVDGTATRNTLRFVGNLFGGGGGLGMGVTAFGTGSLAGDPVLGALLGGTAMVSGRASKAAANALARKAMKGTDEMTRMRSPLYDDLVKQAPLTPINRENQAAVVRALLSARPVENRR